jgi:hypothetical protein
MADRRIIPAKRQPVRGLIVALSPGMMGLPDGRKQNWRNHFRRGLTAMTARAAGWVMGAIVVALSLTPGAAAGPIALHPENPHYLLFRGKPAFLITSGEHYGAVLNLDFDDIPYLDELQARGFNLTRLFSGVYREVPGSFRIRDNTLAPAPGRYLAPWARSRTPGAADGGAKFDLEAWDEAYFHRLKDVCAQAGRRGVVVELVLFCPFYEEAMWEVDPLNARNNVNGVGAVARTEVYTLKHPGLVARQEAFVQKVVGELRGVDNLYYEICNEPYFGGVTLDWQARIASAIQAAEPAPDAKHLIAQNIANGAARVGRPNPAVSIFNFHYANPPEAVALNAGLGRVVADDETGFKGTGDRPYRTEAWLFLLAGGGIFSNLDYSFTAEHEDGTARVTDPTPGGGGPALRKQLSVLRSFLSGFDFIHMAPDVSLIKGGLPAGAAAGVLAKAGREYAVYLSSGPRADLVLELPKGRYRAEWVDPLTGSVTKTGDLDHPGGRATLASPEYAEDVALRILARP